MARPFLYPRSKIPRIDAGEVHVVRPLSARMIEALHEKGLKKAFMSRSTLLRHSPRAKSRLEELGIEVVAASARGKPLSVRLKDVPKIVEMRKDFVPYRKIAAELGLSKSTVHYLMRYAKRDKLKRGKSVIGF